MNYLFEKRAKERVRRTAAPGSKWHTPYRWTVKDGVQVYVPDKPINVFERIQAETDAVDLQAIMQRFESGDRSALNQVESMYMDLVDMPTNYAEMFERMEDLKTIFASMPSEVQSRFNNSPATFWKMAGTREFDDRINSWRSETLARVGRVDQFPINTSKEVKVDVTE